MDDLIRQLQTYVRGMWQHRWLGLASAWLAAIFGGTVVFVMPDQYEATARIFVDTQSVLKPLMSGLAIQPNTDQQIGMLSRTLVSRPNIEKVIRMSDLDLAIKTKEEKERLIDDLVRAIEMKGSGRDNLYTIAIRDSRPEKAKKIVQSLVTIFVESGIGDKRKDTDTARRFIEEQIKQYETRLEEAEHRLKTFRLRNLELSPGGERDYVGRIGEAQTQLTQASLALREAENSRDALKRQMLDDEPDLLFGTPGPGTVAQVATPEIDARIEALKKNLDELLRRYTEQHPDVVGTQRIIAQLEEQRRAEIEAKKNAEHPKGPTSAAAANPVNQQLRVTLAEAEATVASLRARVAEYQQRYEKLKAGARMVPEIEAEFTQLNRDYEVNKRNYESLVARREAAAMSSEMDSTSGLADFRLIDPPRVNPKPVAPNRPMMLSLIFVAAIGFGIAISFLLYQLRPTFSDGRVLREVTGLPVLGTVSMLPDERQIKKTRRGLVAFIGGFLALLAAYGGAFGLLLALARGA